MGFGRAVAAMTRSRLSSTSHAPALCRSLPASSRPLPQRCAASTPCPASA